LFYVERKENNTLHGVRMSVLKMILLSAILMSMIVLERLFPRKSKEKKELYPPDTPITLKHK
jgi:hypothetical protein